MKRSLLGTGILTIALLTGSAFADHDKGRGHDRDHDGWRNHEHAQHVADHDRRPAGWDHGQKRGWGDHNVPPGQAKKQAWEHHEAREQREHEWRERERARREHHVPEHHETREQREQAWRQQHEAREHRMNDWRERERRERERRAEWRRHHQHGPLNAQNSSGSGTTKPTSPVATNRTPPSAPVILPSGRRMPGTQNR
jgi:hypothetical protein